MAATLHAEVQDRLNRAGVEVIETRLNHLAYATEIAEAMLRRQQAAAVVAARRTIVEGAVGMVEDAPRPAGRAPPWSCSTSRPRRRWWPTCWSLLTSEQQTTPIVNTGTLP